MKDLEIPEGYVPEPFEIGFTGIRLLINGVELVEFFHGESDDEYELAKSRCKRMLESYRLAPAMAEEIKRMREQINDLQLGNTALQLERDGWMSMAQEKERELGTRPLPSREDRAFQIVQAYCANPKYTDSTSEEMAEWALVQVDFVYAALAKPQGAQETEKAELKHLLKLAYGIMGCHHEYSVATGWKGHTCPVCSDGQHTENIRKIQVALGYLKDEPKKTELPAGCEPFELERAKVEGARTKHGSLYFFRREESNGWAVFECGKEWWFYTKNGIANGARPESDYHQLYCIAKPVTRRPFDLEAALRGEKVVTRDGRNVCHVQFNQEEDGDVVAYVDRIGYTTFLRDGKYSPEGENLLDLFMEGGV